MYVMRTPIHGAKVDIDRESHQDCACVGVVVTVPDGSKLVMDFADAAAVESFGWALCEAAEALKATDEAHRAANQEHAHA